MDLMQANHPTAIEHNILAYICVLLRRYILCDLHCIDFEFLECVGVLEITDLVTCFILVEFSVTVHTLFLAITVNRKRICYTFDKNQDTSLEYIQQRHPISR